VLRRPLLVPLGDGKTIVTAQRNRDDSVLDLFSNCYLLPSDSVSSYQMRMSYMVYNLTRSFASDQTEFD
jgi:hypothetical protein